MSKWILGVAALTLWSPHAYAAAAPVVIEGPALAVELDAGFPRVSRYLVKSAKAVVEGATASASEIRINGKHAVPQIKFRKLSASSAVYDLSFAELGIDLSFRVSVADSGVLMEATDLRERGTSKLEKLEFVGMPWITLKDQPKPFTLAALYLEGVGPGPCEKVEETLGLLGGLKPGDRTGAYFFAADGVTAVGLASSHIADTRRVAYRISDENGARVCRVQNPEWLFRGPDGALLPRPHVKIFLKGATSAAEPVTWQDAALLYRAGMPHPFGHVFVPNTVADQIAMNFASGAQQPFLRILDNIKRSYLALDGLPQEVLIKGFSAEGHDSANTDGAGHYNERAGGLKDLNLLCAKAKDWNARIGIHINVSEVYPEAHRYHPDILERDGGGNPVAGWRWLDQSFMIDKTVDAQSGRLYAMLNAMRREQPSLDFVYVDTYWTSGWPAWKLAARLAALKLPLYTEGANVLDPWTVWSHQRGNLGGNVMRFLWYSDRDLFGNDPILRTAQHAGFMGWQNERSFPDFIRGVFSENLIAKYLQHFELLKWVPGEYARFSSGVEVRKEGDRIYCRRDGRLIGSWQGNKGRQKLLIPWDPMGEQRLFLWDETGERTEWELPKSWQRLTSVRLYQLTDRGRINETVLPVQNGRVTIQADASKPYVLYSETPGTPKALNWGEGGLVKDPGFDSYSWDAWKVEPSDKAGKGVSIESDRIGNAVLRIAGDSGAVSVSQDIAGLKPAQAYDMSVWAESDGDRPVSLIVSPVNGSGPAITNQVNGTRVTHSAPNDRRRGTKYQPLKVIFRTPAGCTQARITLAAGAGTNAASFDDVRCLATSRPPTPSNLHYFEDFESVDQNWGPFTWIVDEHTHLSEANPSYTDDVIKGRYSLKTMDEPNGRMTMRTTPGTLAFKPHTRYSISFEYICKPGSRYLALVGVGPENESERLLSQAIPEGRGTFNATFTTRDGSETFLGIFKEAGGMLVIDDLAIEELGPDSGL